MSFFGSRDVGRRSDGKGQAPGALVTRPLQQFKKLTGKDGVLSNHERNTYHKHATAAKDDFQKTIVDKRDSDILSQLDRAHREEVLRNKKDLMSIADTILMCGRQNITLQDHRN